MSPEKDIYLETVKRLEKDIAAVDKDAALTSIAVSLKRIADDVSEIETSLHYIKTRMLEE